MTTFTFKYIPERAIADGNLRLKIPESVRIKIDNKEIKHALKADLRKAIQCYFSEDGSWNGPEWQIEMDIAKNDPGTLQIYIDDNASLYVVKQFLIKHSNITIKIDQDSANRRLLAERLNKVGIQITPEKIVTPAFFHSASTNTMPDQKTQVASQGNEKFGITQACAIAGAAVGLFFTNSMGGAIKGAGLGTVVGVTIDSWAAPQPK
jgi:hypothetical protein